jgi:hypothetical protein
MSGETYFRQPDRSRANIIRDKFIELPRKNIDIRAVENADYRSGLPKVVNTAIYVGEDLLAIGDVRWRGRRYDEMAFPKSLYDALALWHMENPSTPAFVVWAFGDEMDVRAWQYNPKEKYEPRVGGRTDRFDDRDIGPMIYVPSGRLETPKVIWTRAELI